MRQCVTVLVAVTTVVGSSAARQPARDSLGRVSFPVSCSPAAQGLFDHAVALLHHMTYPQARAEFARVAVLDSSCAMAHWGIAMTLFQPLWPTRPGPADLEAGRREARLALRLAPRSARERLFIASVDSFFRSPDSLDYWTRVRRWARAMEALHRAFPQDVEATAFYALSVLAIAPPGDSARTYADRAGDLLLQLLQSNPDHPGGMHYLIHANDTPGREGRSLEIVGRYEAVAPANPHALHMPTHIYTRLGRWAAVIDGNVRAAEAALRHPAGAHGEWVWDEFPHALEYLVYAALQQGRDDEAERQWERLRTTDALQPGFKTAFHLASIPARIAVERHDWESAATLVPRTPATLDWDRFPWPEAVVRFARAMGAFRLGRTEDGDREARRLVALEAVADRMGEVLFARQIRILQLEASAWLAHAQARDDSAESLLRRAAELEASTPKHAVTPGPTLPALELLGDFLLERGRPTGALAAYRQSLDRYPARLNSLVGAARAAAAAGDPASARAFYRQVLGLAGGGTRTTLLNEARRALGQNLP